MCVEIDMFPTIEFLNISSFFLDIFWGFLTGKEERDGRRHAAKFAGLGNRTRGALSGCTEPISGMCLDR